MIVCEAPGQNEEEQRKPLVGKAGDKFTEWMTHIGINRDECILANVFTYKPQSNKIDYFFCSPTMARKQNIPVAEDLGKYNSKFLLKQFEGELDYLYKSIVDHKPTTVIAMGNVALWALLGHTQITLYRGTKHKKTFKVANKSHTTEICATFHPANCLYKSDNEQVILADLKEAVS